MTSLQNKKVIENDDDDNDVVKLKLQKSATPSYFIVS